MGRLRRRVELPFRCTGKLVLESGAPESERCS